MEHEPKYDDWISRRRAVEPSRELTDRICAAVEARDLDRQRLPRLADRMNASRLARWAACAAGLLLGSLPFFLAACVSLSSAL